MTRTTVLALIAIGIGTVVGRLFSVPLISAVSRLYGLGAGIGSPPSAWTLAAAVALAVGAAAVAGILPFRPPRRLPAVTILGP
jgi:predicted lysophospholipase L1 biosynthesis ABC-type transport system permease subunit